MKKQILILILAIFAIGFSSSVFGQAVNYSAPRPLVGCDDNILNPIAGKLYNYGATGTPAGGDFTFWATQDPNFISTDVNGATTYNNVAPTLLTVAPNQLMAAGTNYNTPDPATSVEITWSSGLLAGVTAANPLFVAVHYDASGVTDGCADNFKVYNVIPRNGFTVDILNLNPATFLPDGTDPYGYEADQCTDIVRGATWNAVGDMTYDYGTNYLYYEVVASNFTEHWVPTFAWTAGPDALQAATFDYTYSTPDTWGVTPPTWTPLVSGTTPIETAQTSTSDGVSVFIRVTIANQSFENLAGQSLTLAMDGQNAEGQWDVVNATCADPDAADQNDTATQLIGERPTVAPIAPATFE